MAIFANSLSNKMRPFPNIQGVAVKTKRINVCFENEYFVRCRLMVRILIPRDKTFLHEIVCSKWILNDTDFGSRSKLGGLKLLLFRF